MFDLDFQSKTSSESKIFLDQGLFSYILVCRTHLHASGLRRTNENFAQNCPY